MESSRLTIRNHKAVKPVEFNSIPVGDFFFYEKELHLKIASSTVFNFETKQIYPWETPGFKVDFPETTLTIKP